MSNLSAKVCLALLAAMAAVPLHAAEARSGAAAVSPDEYVLVHPESASRGEDAWGTSALTVKLVRIEEFNPPSNAVAFTSVNTGGIYVFQSAGPQVDWWANIDIPSGAVVVAIEMQACDTTATGNVIFGVARMDAPASTGANITPVGTTGTAATPGCGFFAITPNGGSFVIDNFNKSYIIFADWVGDFSAANKVAAFRVYYRLQVSPAPATASFTDVPVGHPQMRFVEALAAAGITGGCGGGNFCPDAPLTRGQMAVFLSTALGLHFPN